MATDTAANRRRVITYGKKPTRPHGFSQSSFEQLLLRTPTKPKSSTLSRVQTPAKASEKPTTSAVDEQVYDVPGSDHDEDEARLDSLLATPSKTPAKRSKTATPQSSKTTAPLSKPKAPAAAVPRKRKIAAHSSSQQTQGQTREKESQQAEANNAVAGGGLHKRLRLGALREEVRHDTSTHQSLDDELRADGDDSRLQGTNLGDLPIAAVAEETDEDTSMADPTDPYSLRESTPEVTKASRAVSLPSTPPRRSGSEASSSSQRKATTTPRQRQLWKSLLDERESTPTREIQRLNLASHKRLAAELISKPSPSKRRLIDTLRASTNSSSPTQPYSPADIDFSTSVASHTPTKSGLKRQESSPDIEHPIGQGSSQTYSRAPKITYAQQRSYLSEQSQSIDELLQQPLDLGISPVAAKPQPKCGNLATDAFQFDDDDDDDGAGGMRSIHELRVGGDAQRFDDFILTIVDDLKDRSKAALSGRRSALLSLAERLKDPAFKARFAEGNHEKKIFSRCKDEVDVMCGVTSCACVILTLTDPVDARSPGQILSTGIIDAFALLLELPEDIRKISKQRETNMSRVSRASVSSFVDSMLSTAIPTADPSIVFSPQLLSLRAIEMLLRRSREAGNTEILLAATAVSKVLSIATEMTAVAFSSTATRSALDARARLQTALSVLESLTLSLQSITDDEVWSSTRVEQVRNILKKLLGLQSANHTALRCLSLRLLLNLSNGNEVNSGIFADEDLVGLLLHGISERFGRLHRLVNEEEHAVDFDELLLCLGALFNLAEMSVEVRRIVASSYAATLKDLVQVFNKQRAKAGQAQSLEESQANVAFGYLAVLLGILCQHPTGRQKIRESLEREDVSVLVEAIEEFRRHHELVDREDSNEVWTNFTARLQSVADALRH